MTHTLLHIIAESLLSALQVTGLVIIMMLLIEYFNVKSRGGWALRLRNSSSGQVLLGALLGIVPGCMGGFAAVSLYTHGLIGFGALIAMMIASSGDEAFVMLAVIPRQALILSAILFVVAVLSGLAVNLFCRGGKAVQPVCGQEFEMHGSDEAPHTGLKNLRHCGWHRIALLVAVALFITALATGLLEHEEEASAEAAGTINLLDEYWLNLTFAAISLFVLWFIAVSDSHFVEEHLWNHVVRHHLPGVFCWTAGTLLFINIGLQYFDIASFTRDNVPFMILLAVLIGVIPESGPHLLFVTLFAGGYVPFSVLLASSISQDGHASLPLLAESRKKFAEAKLINILVASAIGFAAYAMGF